MSSHIVFKALSSDSRKKPATQVKAKAPRKEAPKEKRPVQAPANDKPVFDAAEEVNRRKQEEERLALLQKRREEFTKGFTAELADEDTEKAVKLNDLFELSTLAKLPDYAACIDINKRITYEDIFKIPQVKEFCSSWVDIVKLIKGCENLRCNENDFYYAELTHKSKNLFICISKTAYRLSDLPESMTIGDLRMILGTTPLYIDKKKGCSTADLYFREGPIKANSFFEGKKLKVRKEVDGSIRQVEEPFNYKGRLLSDDLKKSYYTPIDDLHASDKESDDSFDLGDIPIVNKTKGKSKGTAPAAQNRGRK